MSGDRLRDGGGWQEPARPATGLVLAGQQRADLPAAQSQAGLTLDGLRPAYARLERHTLIDQRLQGPVTVELAPPMHYGHRYARHLPGLPVSPDPRPFV